MHRRQFLHASLASAAAIGLPSLVPHRVFGAAAPSNRISVGIIGCGNQSTVDLPAFLALPDVQVTAVCDVNTGSYGYRDKEQFLGRKPVQDKVHAFYAQQQGKGTYKGCDACTDFRQVLQRKDIDAVALIVPDHWHTPMTVLAAKAGRDIYCEKPLTLTIAEGQAMIRAVRDQKRVLQMGSHWRSGVAVRQAAELVRNGRLGKIQRVLVFLPPNNAKTPGPGWKPMPVPKGFDYETWLGPAPEAPYHIDRCLYRFRFILDYSGGQVTNFGTHAFNCVQWALGTDDTTPVEFENLASEFPAKGSLFTTATTINFRARYANGVELLVVSGDPSLFGVRFEGTAGSLRLNYAGLSSDPPGLVESVIGPNEIHLPVSNPQRTENDYKAYVPDHVANFIACVKSRKDPVLPVEVAHRMTSICHLGNITMRLNRKLRFDPAQEQFVGDDEANAMLSRPMRGPWQL